MKKIIFITLVSFPWLSPFFAMAITAGTIPGPSDLGVPTSPITSSQQLLDVLPTIVKWVYTIFFVVAVLFILLAAFNYLTAAGNPEKVKGAHQQLIYAAVAIAIGLIAVSASVIITDFLTPSS